MSLSMYQASIPQLIRMLENLSVILHKAYTYAEAKKIEPSVFIHARLAPDMFSLIRQVQIASDLAKGCAARLANIEVPNFEDTESTFSELQERIAKTIKFIQGVKAEQVNGSETCLISLKSRRQTLEFIGTEYLFNFVLPNFYFHVTTSYAILRHNGVDLGKMDYLGNK